jgi:beta-xylosidase
MSREIHMTDHRKRVRDLLSRMTLAEKAAQLYSVWLRVDESGDSIIKELKGFSLIDSSEKTLDVLANGIGQITRPFGTIGGDPRRIARGLNRIQKYLVEETRLKIPALPHEECLTGVMADGATLFPAGINYGATWDPQLMRKIGEAIGEELRSIGARQGLAPVVDVSRDARWGRIEETLGEDPYLVGCMATAFVQGLQGRDRSVLATLKHFVGHSFSEGGRNHAPVRVGERELNDTFLLPFEMAVKIGRAGSVMPAYHDIDGEPASSSRRHITEVLRNEWGFDGIVVSDYEAISLLYEHHGVAQDAAEASALALSAGIDMELPSFTCFRGGIEEALRRKLISAQDVDAAVMRVLAEKSRLGLFEHPYVDEGGVAFNTVPHRSVAAEAAEKSIVLLKNDGVLPLGREGKTALIGPLADDPFAFFSGYSFPVHVANGMRAPISETRYGKTLREALSERLSGPHQLEYCRGCDILAGDSARSRPVFPGDAASEKGQTLNQVSFSEAGISEAVSVALRCDRIILAVGDRAGIFLTGTVGEGSDAASLTLPGVQQKLLNSLLALGKPMVIVLINGRPYNIQEGYSAANAVVEAWLPGQEGGDALSRILLGEAEPGGRLPVSIPRSAGAMPYHYNHKLKSAGTPVQQEYGALFPFGFGLSYTRFEYDGFFLAEKTVPVDGQISIGCHVTNRGGRRGDEVVQLYVRDLYASFVRPVMELKGFVRITLAPGEAAEVSFQLPTDMLAFTVKGTERVVEPGQFRLMIGSSCGDIKHTETVEVTGKPRRLPVNWRMQSETRVRIEGKGG